MRGFIVVALACIVIGLIMAKVPACQPRDASECTYVENHYECPEDK